MEVCSQVIQVPQSETEVQHTVQLYESYELCVTRRRDTAKANFMKGIASLCLDQLYGLLVLHVQQRNIMPHAQTP